MEQKAFDVIVEKLGEVLAKQEFKRAPDESEDGVRLAVFTGENLAYAVAYSMKTKRIELRTCAMTDDGPDKNWKTISGWLYDPQPGESDDTESIVNDFCETVEGPKRVAALQTAKKKRTKSEFIHKSGVHSFTADTMLAGETTSLLYRTLEKTSAALEIPIETIIDHISGLKPAI